MVVLLLAGCAAPGESGPGDEPDTKQDRPADEPRSSENTTDPGKLFDCPADVADQGTIRSWSQGEAYAIHLDRDDDGEADDTIMLEGETVWVREQGRCSEGSEEDLIQGWRLEHPRLGDASTATWVIVSIP